MVEFWLVIVLYMKEHDPVKLRDIKVPSIEKCLEMSKTELDKVSKITSDEPFEFAVTCTVTKPDTQEANP